MNFRRTQIFTVWHVEFCFPCLGTKFLLCARVCARSVVSDSATPWTVAHQAPVSMEFCRQEYWIRLPFPSPGDLPDSFESPAWAGRFFTLPPGKP